MEGPDHMLSSDKEEMKKLVKFKKNFNKFDKWNKLLNKKEKKIIKTLIGDGIKKIQPNEYITINSQKKVYMPLEKLKRKNLHITTFLLKDLPADCCQSI